MDFYGGYKGEITKDFGYDVGILQYYYPQKDKVGQLRHHRALRRVDLDLRSPSSTRTPSPTTTSASARPSRWLGASPKPKGQNTGYIELNANFPLMDKLTLNGHVGYTNFAK